MSCASPSSAARVSGAAHRPSTTQHPAASSLLQRFNRADAIDDRIRIEHGSIADYRALSRFHYRSAHPGAVTSIFRLVLNAPSVSGRYLRREGERQVIGVLVRGLPQLSCRLRNVAVGGRYDGLRPREAAAMLNRELRTISRVVLDPRFRGGGLAVRLVKHALEHIEPGVIYTEALAAMGRISPFFERAGMTRYELPLEARPLDARLVDALHRIDLPPVMLASTELAIQRIAEMPGGDRALLECELRRWRRGTARASAAAAAVTPLNELLDAARRRLLAQPVYYLKKCERQE